MAAPTEVVTGSGSPTSKGAARTTDAAGVEGIGAVLDRIPLRLGDTQVIAAPLFHAWGLSHLMLGLARCTTNVLHRRFDPERTLRALVVHRADALVVVPVMLARMLGVEGRVQREGEVVHFIAGRVVDLSRALAGIEGGGRV